MTRRLPYLGVGCHVVLVDGLPTLPAAELPTLVDPVTERFRPTLGAFFRDLMLNRIRPEEIEAEAKAQMARLQEMGVALTHLDTHKHTHIFPQVLAPLLRAAKRRGLLAVRNPFEPRWSLEATAGAPLLRRLQIYALNRYQDRFLQEIAEAGMITTNGTIGVLATGTLDEATLFSLLEAMPDGTWELVTHPGINDADLERANTRLRASRETEVAALDAVEIAPEIHLASYADLIRRDGG